MRCPAPNTLAIALVCVLSCTTARAQEDTSGGDPCWLEDWAIGDRECEKCYPGENDCIQEAQAQGLSEVCNDDDSVILCDNSGNGCSVTRTPSRTRRPALLLTLALFGGGLMAFQISRRRARCADMIQRSSCSRLAATPRIPGLARKASR